MQNQLKHTKIGKFKIQFENEPEFHGLKREIFGQDCYFFESSSAQPIILDIGAHIGLSTLYFKSLHPGAKITCLEPVPSSFELLERNVFENRLDDVTCLQLALSQSTNPLTLHIDPEKSNWYSSASVRPGAWNGQQPTQIIEVKTSTLDKLITYPIDLLKLDIEGAEQTILENNQQLFPKIKQLLIEFHPGGNQSLDKICSLLEKSGYKLEYRKNGQTVPKQRAKGLVVIHASKN